MEPACSSPFTQEFATGPYPEPAESCARNRAPFLNPVWKLSYFRSNTPILFVRFKFSD
jgi:hypothetical protein